MADGNEFTNIRPIGAQGEFTNVRPIASPTQATAPTDPFGFATTGTGGGPEAELSRRHARSRVGLDAPEKQQGWLEKQLRGAGDAAVDIGKGIGGMIGTAGDIVSGTPGVPNLTQARALSSVVQPQIQQAQKGAATTGVESAGHYAAAALPFAGPMAAESGESIGRGEVGRGLVYGAAAIQARPYRGTKLPSAVDYDMGMKAIDNSWQFGGYKMLRDSLLRAKNEVETHVQNIVQADRASNTRAGVPGTYSVQPDSDLLMNQLGKYDPARVAVMPHTTPIRAMLHEQSGAPLPFEVYKDLRSRVGRAWAEASKTGNAREAGVLDDVYKQMGQQMQTNTRSIGVADSFKQYNTLHRQVTAAEHGPIGDALKNDPNPQVNPNGNGADFWGKLQDPKMQRVVRKGLDDLRSYGLSQKFFDLMDKEVKPIYDTVTNKGKFDFKTRLALAGTFAMMGIGRPFLTAYAAMYLPQVLKMARAAMAERGLAQGGLAPGSMFTPPLAPSNVAPGIPELSQTEVPGGEPLDEAMRRGAPGTPPAEPTPASPKEARDVEASKRKEATSRAAMSKADVAGKVEAARKQRSVYKGRRGGTK